MVLIAIIIFILYLGVNIKWFGIPSSLSNTYYLLEEKKKGLGVMFTLMTWLVVFLLMPVWLDKTPENSQFLAFLASASLLFVGTASQFKMPMTREVHFVSAGICLLTSQIWLMVIGVWYIPIIVYALYALYYFFRSKDNWLFWVEMLAFITTFIAVLVY